jgi:steroid delta-isomerase-like uncharacterized protein
MSEQVKARVRQFYDEVVNAGAIDRVDEFCTEDFVDHEEFPGIPGTREGVKQFFAMMRSAFPDFRIDVQDIVAEGDKVAVLMKMSGTQEGEFMGIPASHKRFEIAAVDWLRMEGGERAAEHWGAGDMLAMMQQLGAIPEQAPA